MAALMSSEVGSLNLLPRFVRPERGDLRNRPDLTLLGIICFGSLMIVERLP